MTDTIKLLRSSTAGNRPAGHAYGEAYVNFPDMQLGAVDSTGTAQDLLAVRKFSTAASYVVGDYVTYGGVLFRAIAASAPGSFVSANWQVAGGSAVTVSDTAPASPTNGQLWFDSIGAQLYLWYTDPTSSQWVIAVNNPSLPEAPTDGQIYGRQNSAWAVMPAPVMGRNILHNGDMRISQRYGNAVVTPNTQLWYPDRWICASSPTGHWTFQQVASTTPGSAYALKAIGSATAYTAAAADVFIFLQGIEGLNIAHLHWGTPNAQTITISGIIENPNVSGSYAICVRNGAANRSYVALVTVNAANVDTPFAVTIPGDTAGTWPTDNSVAMYVSLDLGSGSNYNPASANTWSAGNFTRAAGSVNLTSTANATVTIKDLQMEVGSVATPFERLTYSAQLSQCQRYYNRFTGTAAGVFYVTGYAAGAGVVILSHVSFPSMRAPPTVNPIGTWIFANCSVLTLDPAGCNNCTRVYTSATAAGTVTLYSPANGGFELVADI